MSIQLTNERKAKNTLDSLSTVLYEEGLLPCMASLLSLLLLLLLLLLLSLLLLSLLLLLLLRLMSDLKNNHNHRKITEIQNLL